MQASMKLGEAVYKASQEEAQAGEAGEDFAGAPGDDAAGPSSNMGDDATVVDADFEEVDPEKDKKDG
jgi:molecular chaperone DnaK